MALAAVVVSTTPLASAEERETPQLSDKVSDALRDKLKPLQDTRNYNGMLDLMDSLLQTAAPGSYDNAYLLDIKGRIYLTTDQLTKAIEPWEQVIKLNRQHHYFDEKDELEKIKIVAQLLFQEANNTKDKELQHTLVAQSLEYLVEYLRRNPKAEPELQMMYANILYAEATADAAHVNLDQLKQALDIVNKGMLGAIHPKEGFYLLKLVILQQLNDYEQAARLTELILTQNPNRKDLWPMLFGTYVNLAGAAKPESDEQRSYYARAINTMERAQKLGFMTAPRDNYNLVTLYLNAGQFGTATEMLQDGMEKGKIESTVNNWRILGAYYQQDSKELQAISALEEATKLFPKEGSLEFLIGQIYQQLDRTKEAHAHYLRATQKGNLGEKPHQVYLFLAYTALELEDFDGALQAINKAAAMPDGAKDPQVKSVKAGIEATIADKKAREEAAKQSAKRY